MRQRIAWWLRCWADRLDHRGAPKSLGWSFTFMPRQGVVFHADRTTGCPLWYLGDDDYLKANPPVDWETLTDRWGDARHQDTPEVESP